MGEGLAKVYSSVEDLHLCEDWEGGGVWSMWTVYENKIIDLQDQFMMRLISIRMGLWT